MKKSKIAKRAFVLSVASIFICILMLIGSTFAWFTETVKTGKNTIQAGNLDIALYHSNGSTTDTMVDENTELFKVSLWEPGTMAYESFRVHNYGDLAVKYQLLMNIDKYNTVLDTGKSLKDVLKVSVYDGKWEGTREDAQKLAFNQDLNNFVKEDFMENKDDESYFTVFIYWAPSDNDTDNSYNLNEERTSSDSKPLYIELGVKLTATQHAFEEDSFGNDYDDMIEYQTVSTPDEFTAKLQNLQDGEGIKLTQDITISYFNKTTDGEAVINLNNNTLKTTQEYSSSVLKGSLVLKNGTLDFTMLDDRNPDPYAVLVVSEGASLTLKDVDYKVVGSGIEPHGKATIDIIDSTITSTGYSFSTNATKDASNKPMYGGFTLNIKNSTLTALSSGSVGSALLVNVPCTVNIENSTLNGSLHGLAVRGGDVTVRNSTINNAVDSGTYNTFEAAHFHTLAPNWGQGNIMPGAALLIGNKTPGSYQYPANVTLYNTTINSSSLDGGGVLPTVYMYGNTTPGNGATLTYDSASSVGEIVRANDYVNVIEID